MGALPDEWIDERRSTKLPSDLKNAGLLILVPDPRPCLISILSLFKCLEGWNPLKKQLPTLEPKF